MSSESYQVLVLVFTRQNRDEASVWLMNEHALGIIPEGDSGLRVYFAHTLPLASLKTKLTRTYPETKIISEHAVVFGQKTEEERDFPSFALTKCVTIHSPLKHKIAADDQQNMIIKQGPAFGTGLHDTTKLCAQLLEDSVIAGKSFLDVGCGSGILSILAQKMGAAKITAIDIDRLARQNTAENFFLNNLHQGTILANLDQLTTKHDVVVANMLAPTLIFLAPKILNYLTLQGTLIMSGLTEDEFTSVNTAFTQKNTLVLAKTIHQQPWLGLVYTFCLSN